MVEVGGQVVNGIVTANSRMKGHEGGKDVCLNSAGELVCLEAALLVVLDSLLGQL